MQDLPLAIIFSAIRILEKGTMKLMPKASIARNEITEGVLWKQMLLFCFPIVIGTFFQQLYNTIDAVIVGNFVGKQALAAVGGSTGTIINTLVGFFVGLSSGATVIISQFYGANRPQETSDSVHTSIALAIYGGLALSVIGLFISGPSLRLLGTPEEIMHNARTYMRIYFCGTTFSLVYNIGSGVLRAIGDSRRPLYFLIICSVSNLVLDLLFVLLFRMGVSGVALATILSQAISAFLVILTLMRSQTSFQLVLRKIRLHFNLLGQIIRIGLPAGLQSTMYSISNLLIQSSVNSFGTDAVAAWTAFGKMDGIFWMLMGALGVTTTTFVGQNYGANRMDRVRKCINLSLGMALGFSVPLGILLAVVGRTILKFFTSDDHVLDLGLQVLRVYAPFYFAFISIEVLSGAMRGVGDTFIPMLMTAIGVCVLRIVWVCFIVPLNRSLTMVAIGYPITWAITSLFFILYYISGRWMPDRKRKPKPVI